MMELGEDQLMVAFPPILIKWMGRASLQVECTPTIAGPEGLFSVVKV